MTQSGPHDRQTLEQRRTGSGDLDTGGHVQAGQVALELAPEPDGHTARPASADPADQPGYEWVALSVTTVGALLASLQCSYLAIALPDVLTGLGATFLTIRWRLLVDVLITTALVPVVGRLAHTVPRRR